MAHERLSPRQKMIGMMYLVLTAMLALNVTKEAVKAFMKVEEGLTKTVKNYALKNKEIYDKFDMKAAENPIKSGAARDEAYEIKKAADELFDMLQGLKIQIIKKTEGEDTKAVKGDQIDIYAVQRYDNNNIPSEILIGAKENGKAFALRAAINDYREFLVEKLKGKNKTIEDALRSSLNTDMGKDESGKPEPWPNNVFQTLPLVAAVAMLSKIQVDVRNAETDVLGWLYDQIDAASFKFNRLIPTVIAPSTYVMEGLDYEANVFFAAVDTTQKPTVTVGNYKTTQNADGTVKYEMTGDFTTLPVDETGKGVYKTRAGGNPGQRIWGGLITMNAPNGEVLSKPFSGVYTVGAQNVVISPTAMNMLYRGIPNPIDVLVPGVGPDKIRVSMKNGTIFKGQVRNYKDELFPGSWIAEPDTKPPSPTAQIIVSADINGRQQQFRPMEFRVKDIPNPEAQFANVSGQGTVTKADILLAQGVLAVLKDFDFNLRFTVTEFALSFDDRGLAVGATSKSNRISDEQKSILNRLTKGKTLYVQDIKAIGPDKKERSLSPIIIKVN